MSGDLMMMPHMATRQPAAWPMPRLVAASRAAHRRVAVPISTVRLIADFS